MLYNSVRQASAGTLEQQYVELSLDKPDKALLFVSDVDAKISADDAVPAAWVVVVEVFLYFLSHVYGSTTDYLFR